MSTRDGPKKAARFEDTDAARKAIARLGRRLESIEPVVAFRPGLPKRPAR